MTPGRIIALLAVMVAVAAVGYIVLRPDDEETDDFATVTRLYPAAGQTISSSGGYWQRFTFEPIQGVEWYRIWIGGADYQFTVMDEWYPAAPSSTDNPYDAGICDETVCTIPLDIWSPNGDYAWWMTYWGADLPAFDSYWHSDEFTVAMPPPGDIQNRQPVDNVETSPAALTWTHDPHVLWYQVWLGTADYATTIGLNWFDARSICADGVTCSLPLETELPPGDYEWWLETWGPGGYNTWYDNEAIGFTVSPQS